jgi:hypothetical protein
MLQQRVEKLSSLRLSSGEKRGREFSDVNRHRSPFARIIKIQLLFIDYNLPNGIYEMKFVDVSVIKAKFSLN